MHMHALQTGSPTIQPFSVGDEAIAIANAIDATVLSTSICQQTKQTVDTAAIVRGIHSEKMAPLGNEGDHLDLQECQHAVKNWQSKNCDHTDLQAGNIRVPD